VVVRVTLLGALVDVGEDAEAELGVFVEDLAAPGVSVAEMASVKALSLSMSWTRAHTFFRPSGPGSDSSTRRQAAANCSRV